MLIADIYHHHAVTIPANKTIREALSLCIKQKVNGLVVLNETEQVVGVLSVQDIAAATIPSQFRQNIAMAAAMYKKGFFHEMCAEIKDQPLTNFMRKNFEYVNLHDNIMTITAEFLKNDLYIVPVIEEGKLLGIVTRSEIKGALAYGMNLGEHPQKKYQNQSKNTV